MSQSPRLSLPYIAPAQAQKHVTHNEALRQLDTLVQLSVEAIGTEVPPALPENGMVWALGAVPLSDWAGNAHRLATWQENAWHFIAPQIGWTAWDRTNEILCVWTGAGWDQITADIGMPQSIGINTSADATNRLAISSEASLFNNNGAGHQMKINKATAANTASLLFQSGFSGRAEMGLAGNDDFSIKVSADGNSWANAMVIDRSAGKVGLGITAPVRTLHVSSAMRLEPSTAPSSPAAGDIYFDSATKKLRCHDGTQWNNLF